MRLHRFYIEQKIGENGNISISDSELINQLMNVFRFRSGDKVILFDGSGSEYEAEIILLSKKQVDLKIIDKKSHSADATRDKKVSLYLSLIKKSNFELAVEKCTEVGVTEIHSIISERSEKKDLNLERLNKIVKEASEQSGRVTLPEVFEITDLEKAVSQAMAEGKVCVTFHTDSISPAIRMSTSPHLMGGEEDNVSSPSLVKEGARGQLCLFIGPEGGWSDTEMNLFKKNNFKILSLGQNILRAETAAIIATWNSLNN
jgi:16S rRNA (uracil1498-N3)-methyltransferase